MAYLRMRNVQAKAKKAHLVDEYDGQIIARAHHFTAFQFRGRGVRVKVDNLPTLEAARAAAAVIVAEHTNRPCSIYAVRDGMQAHVENIYAPQPFEKQ